MQTDNTNPAPVWLVPVWAWASLIFVIALTGVSLYGDGLNRMFNNWFTRDEYSHGILIPFISLFLVWQKRDVLERTPFSGSWGGFAVAVVGAALILLGDISAITIFIQYGVFVVLTGLVLALTGWQAFKTIWMAPALLFFTVPLPGVIFQELSQQLQLISSQLGVLVIKAFGISVYAEGNVIDLGSMKLQVVEACSGLRYLFPLMTLGLIAAYFYRDTMWKRVVVFLSSIPITIFMNSFRIGAIGVLVEFWGRTMAEGFLHDFEGWLVFMACTGILIAEIWLLSRLGGKQRQLQDIFSIDFPAPRPQDAETRLHPIGASYIAAMVFTVLAVLGFGLMPERTDAKVTRTSFSEFPMSISGWQGKTGQLDKMYIDALHFDDYLLADYVDDAKRPVNLYTAYYQSQSKGESIHSPRACIPGGGWKITSFTQHAVQGATFGNSPLMVNRTLIQLGDHKQLVYYWFQSHGRNLTNEYLLKWYVFWDALTIKRTDGALVRLTTPVLPNEDLAEADKRLSAFAQAVSPVLGKYIPD